MTNFCKYRYLSKDYHCHSGLNIWQKHFFSLLVEIICIFLEQNNKYNSNHLLLWMIFML